MRILRVSAPFSGFLAQIDNIGLLIDSDRSLS